MWGNKVSLVEDLTKRGETAYARLHDWYPNNYSSNWMYLAVQSPHTLDQLQEWVEEIFTAIPNRGLDKPAGEPQYAAGSAYTGQNVSRVCRYIPIKDKHTVDFVWSLPAQSKHYKIKPLHYLGWLVGHEGKGSILSYFKKRDWAHEMYAGNGGGGAEDNGFHSEFSIQLRVTDNGLAHWEDMAAVIFQYLKLLRQLPKTEQRRIFDEIQKIETINWSTKEDHKSLTNAVDAAENMREYPSSDWLTGDQLLTEYSDEVITAALHELGPENCFVFLSSKSFDEKELEHTEQWMGGKYSIVDIDKSLVRKWMDVELLPDLHVPASNKYLAESLEVKSDEKSLGMFSV